MRLKTALLACAMTMTMAGAAQARQITSIRLETTITNPTEGWIQIQEITAEANGVNVAAASNGGSAQATSIYSAGYEADKIIDGIEQQGNFYHSGTPQGDIVTLSFARRSDVTRITYYGRQDCCQYRDVLRYTLYDGSTVVGSGVLDASTSHAAVVELESQPTPSRWDVGSWGQWSTTCGSASRSRTVQCISPDTGSVAPDASCQSARPTSSETSYQTSGCGYSWTPGSYGSPAPACGATTSSRTVTCTRSDGQDADPSLCSQATKPVTETAATDYSTCTYDFVTSEWSDWSSHCSANARRERAVWCDRSDGTRMDPDHSWCYNAGKSYPGGARGFEEYAPVYDGCGFAWKTGEWTGAVPACGTTVENRSVTCERSDGQPVADSSCPAADRPTATRSATSYSTCGFSWEAGAWSAPSRTCGTSSRTRTVSCLRSDGSTVTDASCTGERPSTEETVADFSTCSHSWSYGPWSAVPASCGETSQTRTATCVRQDGTTVDGSLCGTPEPTEQAASDYSACSFRWQTGAWSTPSACGTTTRSREVTCLRSDGTDAAANQCDAATRPASSEQVGDISACQYGWVQTGYGEWGACVSGSQSRSITSVCRRSDGTTAPAASCGSSQAPMHESRACSSPVTPPTGGQPADGQVIFRRVIDIRPR